MYCAYGAAAAGFLLAAVVMVALNAVSPFERGWWLASYLFLVGGVSQVLLGGGQYMVATGRHAAPPARRLSWAQLALWNIGTVTVAGADMARVMPGVTAGSAILVVAPHPVPRRAATDEADGPQSNASPRGRLHHAAGRTRRLRSPRHFPRRSRPRSVVGTALLSPSNHPAWRLELIHQRRSAAIPPASASVSAAAASRGVMRAAVSRQRSTIRSVSLDSWTATPAVSDDASSTSSSPSAPV